MSKNNKSTLSQALGDIEVIKEAIKKETTNTLKTILEDTVKDAIRDSVADEEQDDEDMVITNGEESTEDTAEKDGENAEAAKDASDEESTESEEGEGDSEGDEEGEWSEFSDYQVGDNAYDLTAVKDYDQVVKIFKKLNNDDEVVVHKDGDKVSLSDNETGAEYVIDLGDDEASKSEPSDEQALNETEELDDIIIDDEMGADGDNFEIELDSNEDEDGIAGIPGINEGKNKKNMKNEILFEVDLGYTDNYQSKDPIQGLSNAEPSKNVTLDKGIPTGTEKPWAGKGTEKKGEPFNDSVNECGDGMDCEVPVEEGTNVTLPNSRKKVKSHTPDTEKKNYPQVHHHDSVAGEYKAMNESLMKENKTLKKAVKALKENIEELKQALEETYITNVNLGKCTKLFTENATSKAEKADIVKRFTNVKSVEESTRLYEAIQAELSKKNTTPVLESKVSTAKQTINESRNSSDASLMRTLDLIQRMKNC